MKKLVIISSVLMLMTAPMMAQQPSAGTNQDDVGLWNIAKEYVFGSEEESAIKSLDQKQIDALLTKALGDPKEAAKTAPPIKEQVKAAGIIGILADAAKDAFIAKNPQWGAYVEKLAGVLNFLKQNYPQLLQNNTDGFGFISKFFTAALTFLDANPEIKAKINPEVFNSLNEFAKKNNLLSEASK